MSKRILICGLPGSGKTTLAASLKYLLEYNGKKVSWLNADEVRKEYNDWDFTIEGRIRQSKRMRSLASLIECDYVICDFVAPLVEMRTCFAADYTIWLDTTKSGRFEDTNSMFIAPDTYDIKVTEQDSEKWSAIIVKDLLK